MMKTDNSVSFLNLKKFVETVPTTESKLKIQGEKLIVLIKNALTSSNAFTAEIFKLFDEGFQFRMEAIKWIKEEGIRDESINFEGVYEAVGDNFEEKENSTNEILIENVLFGIRCLKKVIKKIDAGNDSLAVDLSAEEDLPKLSYQQFINILKYALKDAPAEFRENYFQFFGTSLMLEISIIAADILIEEQPNFIISKQKLEELNEAIVENAQVYLASFNAMQKTEKTNHKMIHPLSTEEIAQEVTFAESGMDDYLNQLNEQNKN